MTFLLDIMLTLSGTAVPSGTCNHGHCKIPPKLTSPNLRIEPALYWPCSAGHNFDGNAITTEHNSFSCHLQGSDGTSIQPGTKGRACWFCH